MKVHRTGETSTASGSYSKVLDNPSCCAMAKRSDPCQRTNIPAQQHSELVPPCPVVSSSAPCPLITTATHLHEDCLRVQRCAAPACAAAALARLICCAPRRARPRCVIAGATSSVILGIRVIHMLSQPAGSSVAGRVQQQEMQLSIWRGGFSDSLRWEGVINSNSTRF